MYLFQQFFLPSCPTPRDRQASYPYSGIPVGKTIAFFRTFVLIDILDAKDVKSTKYFKMKKSPYYFEIKDIMTQFVSAFDNVVISRYNKSRDEKDKIHVRYAYAPKQRVIHELLNKSQHISVPCIAVNISSITRDAQRVFNKIAGTYHSRTVNFAGVSGLATASDHLPSPIPVNIGVNMSILTKYQTDMDQILSNFIPYSNPYIVISWKIPNEILQQDHEIRSEVLWSDSISINYPVDLNASTPFRISADTSFTIKGWLFKEKIDTAGNIFVIDTHFTPIPDLTDIDVLQATESVSTDPEGSIKGSR